MSARSEHEAVLRAIEFFKRYGFFVVAGGASLFFLGWWLWHLVTS